MCEMAECVRTKRIFNQAGLEDMSRPQNHRQAKLSRRSFVQLGSLGLCGLTLPQLLAAKSSRTLGGESSAKSCIFLVLSGGPSQLDTFDPKPHAPAEIRGAYQPIGTRTPGVFLSEQFPQLSRMSDKYCLARSLSHKDTVHVTAAHTMLSGQPDGSKKDDSPFLGSLVSYFRPSAGIMPSQVWLHNMKTGTNKVPRYNSGLSKVGMAQAPLRIGHELDNPAAADFRVTEFDPPAGLSRGQFQHRFQLLNQLEASRSFNNSPSAEGYRVFQARAQELLTGPSASRVRFEPRTRLRSRKIRPASVGAIHADGSAVD